MKDFQYLLSDSDALIIVPPFWASDMPSLGVHILQESARIVGLKVRVLYVNLIMAADVGENPFIMACWESLGLLTGEAIFSRSAYGRSDVQAMLNKKYIPHYRGKHRLEQLRPYRMDVQNRTYAILDRFIDFERRSGKWLDDIVDTILRCNFPVIGCSTNYQQTNAGVAILNRIKEKNKKITTIIGGANCAGEMAEGIASLSKNIDYIFSGYSEGTFPRFLADTLAGNAPSQQIIQENGSPDFTDQATPDYSEFYEQLRFFIPDSEVLKNNRVRIPYETSRGCWWGEKNKCLFCGMNSNDIRYRRKKTRKVLEDLEVLTDSFPTNQIMMSDSILSKDYFDRFLPELAKRKNKTNMFFEVKPQINYHQLGVLRDAGISTLQAGIETLSTSLLNKLNKGVTAFQNIIFLRNARSLGVKVLWNILWGFPGDTYDEYCEVLSRIKLCKHFSPPQVAPMLITRFSEYFENPLAHGLSNIKPLEIYRTVYPPYCAVDKLAFDFRADYRSYSRENDELVVAIYEEVDDWNERWRKKNPPNLFLSKISDTRFLLFDSRKVNSGEEKSNILSRIEAITVLIDRRIQEDIFPELTERALADSYIVGVDDRYASLVTASSELYNELGSNAKSIKA